MEPQDLDDRLDFMHGLILGLQAAVRGLIASHPNPDAAIEQVHLCLEDMHAAGLASTATTDKVLHGLGQTTGYVLPTQAQIERASGRR